MLRGYSRARSLTQLACESPDRMSVLLIFLLYKWSRIRLRLARYPSQASYSVDSSHSAGETYSVERLVTHNIDCKARELSVNHLARYIAVSLTASSLIQLREDNLLTGGLPQHSALRRRVGYTDPTTRQIAPRAFDWSRVL